MPIQNFDRSTQQDDILGLQDQISRLQQISDHVVNANNAGIGSTVPFRVQAGIQVPPAQSLQAKVLGLVGTATNVAVTWQEPVVNTDNVNHYNIYGLGIIKQQTQELLLCAVHTSPAVFTVFPDGANKIRVIVQTVLNNGQTLPIPDCPSTAFTSLFPQTLTVWGPLSFAAGWAQQGAPYYITNATHVPGSLFTSMSGAAHTASYVDGSQIGTLPTAVPSLFPSASVVVPVTFQDNTAGSIGTGRIAINTSGQIFITSPATAGHDVTVWFDSINFRL